MNAEYLHEPELEFGTDHHIDVKFGLMNYGPLDFDNPLAPKRIRVGIVGTPESVEGVVKWLEKCRQGIPAKPSKRPNLFPRFPGYGDGLSLCADFVLDIKLQRTIPESQFRKLCEQSRSDAVFQELAQLFMTELTDIVEKTTADVLICAFPFILVQFIEQEYDGQDISSRAEGEDEEYEGRPSNASPRSRIIFHDLLKALAMPLRKPIQVIRPGTYDETKQLSQKRPGGEKRRLQDEATRAWNMYTALYYKAGGVPWRLMRNYSQLDACYVGISFYEALDKSRLLTSVAQVFNERGEGVVLRGGTAKRSKDDRQIHLTSGDAYNLLKQVLEAYRHEHKNLPARVVVHKSSVHDAFELDGFARALEAFAIQPDQADFISVTRSFTRLLRAGRYPPLRGTLLHLEGQPHVLYTKGSVDFFSAYPALYIPLPLGFRCDQTTETPTFLAREILSLTKMNWNNTQFDGGEPITLRASQQVGSILKYVQQDFQQSYRYYM